MDNNVLEEYIKSLTDRELLEKIYSLLIMNTQISIQTRHEINQDDKELSINILANLLANKAERGLNG